MKKLIVFGLWFLIIGFFVATPASAQTATLSLSPATGTFNHGCSFSVDVKLDTGSAQTDGTDVVLFYDPTRFKANAVRKGTAYPLEGGSSIDESKGMVSYSGLADVAQAFSGSAVVATVDFMVLATAPAGATQIKFDFDPNDKAKTTDSNVVERGAVTDILNQAVGGTFTIGSGTGCSGAVVPTIVARGGPDEATSSLEPLPTKVAVFPKTPAGDAQTTIILSVAGSILLLIGFFGLVWR